MPPEPPPAPSPAPSPAPTAAGPAAATRRRGGTRRPAPLSGPPDWYRDAVIYEVHVKAFADSSGDGVGDFPGLTGRLDYLRDLGVTALWLLPFYPSPLRDDGYDIADYRAVHPAYGTMADFRAFLRAAHERGLRVVTELVLNHTSDQHPWFQRARRAKAGSRWRDWYVWSDDPRRYAGARIIFQDFETSNWAWDPVAGAYYWHRFYSHQPDLNFANPEVQAEMLKVVDFWLSAGVDGLRLDAVPYLFEAEGTTSENLPETHAFLKRLRSHVDRHHPGRMLLAEANQWPEDAVAYFGDGDECHMAFHFPLMPRLYLALQQEDRFGLIDILEQTPAIPPGCQWALFLRNHDELTLEMVTDEERDALWRAYAGDRQARINLGIRRRLAPLLDHDRRRIELLNLLLLSLPGTPVLYYGDEIGMGDNVYLGDRNGVRTPMQWSPDRNAGFSTANPQRLYLPPVMDPACHYEAVNVAAQLESPSSLLWWTRRVLAVRRLHPVLGRGGLEFLHPDNNRVLAFLRTPPDDEPDGESVLVVANLSRHPQVVDLDLHRYRGLAPVELFGRTTFPAVGDGPYRFTLGGHGFYWLSLTPRRDHAAAPRPGVVDVTGRWGSLFGEARRAALGEAVARYLPRQGWFSGVGRRIRDLQILDVARLGADGCEAAALVVVEARFSTGEPVRAVLGLAVVAGAAAEHIRADRPEVVLAAARRGGEEAVLFDAMSTGLLAPVLSSLVRGARRVRSETGAVRGVPAAVPAPEGAAVPDTAADGVAEPTPSGGRRREDAAFPLTAPPGEATSPAPGWTRLRVPGGLVVGVRRVIEAGEDPEQELGDLLARRGFTAVAPLRGVVEWEPHAEEPATLAVVHGAVAHEGDGWRRSVAELGRRLEASLRSDGVPPAVDLSVGGLLAQAAAPAGEPEDRLMVAAVHLGDGLGRLHLALCDPDDPRFAPEPFGDLQRRSLRQAFTSRARRHLDALERALPSLGDGDAAVARELLGERARVAEALAAPTRRALRSARIRIHGALRLSRVLWTGRQVVFVGVGGPPDRPAGERRIRRSPYRDVATLLRSFEHAAWAARGELAARGLAPPERAGALDRVQARWQADASAWMLRAYLEATAGAPFAADDPGEIESLLVALALDLALEEVAGAAGPQGVAGPQGAGGRPGWLAVSLRAALALSGVRAWEPAGP